MAKLPTLAQVLATPFRFEVIPDDDGGFVIVYPELAGCMTQVETLEEVPAAAREIKQLWLETEYETDPRGLADLVKLPA